MPQVWKGPRLWLYERDGRQSIWLIRDGKFQFSTGTPDRAEAAGILANYIASPKLFKSKYKKTKQVSRYKIRWLYFIEMVAEDRPVKIGVADDVRARLWNLGVGTPFQLQLLASIQVPQAVEEQVHGLLAADRIRGEWFRRSAQLSEIIEAAKDGTLLAYLTKVCGKVCGQKGHHENEIRATP